MDANRDAPAIRNVLTHLIAGSATERRAGLAALLAKRPAGERWALLAAANRLGGATAGYGDGIVVRSAPFGCFGCMPEVPLRVAINRLLREARPARLIVEIERASERERAIALVRSFGATLRLDDERPPTPAIR